MRTTATLIALCVLACPTSAATTEPPGHPAAAPETQPAGVRAPSAASSQPVPLEVRAYRLAYPSGLHAEVGEAASERGGDPFVLLALLMAESGLQPKVKASKRGCVGVAQMCGGGRRLVTRLRRTRGLPEFTAADALDPHLAIPAAAEFLVWAMDACRGDVGCAVRTYNVGSPGRANGFARQVLRAADRLRTAAGLPPAYREREQNPLTPLPTS